MWLCNSSIGRKVIMSVTGMALILFLTFHGCMNVVALISGEGYNKICEFLGANWYAVAATVVLMALIFIHIVYAFILTLQNRKARGNNRYAVTDKPDKVEWSSQNMLLLGIIVLLGLILHLYNFWYNMMFAELAGPVPHLDRSHLASPHPRYVVSHPDCGLERQGVVQTLEAHRQHLCDLRDAHVRCSDIRLCYRTGTVSSLKLTLL